MRWRILLFLSALSAIAALAGCSKSGENPREIIRPVLSMVIEPQTTRTFGFAGSIEPQVSADLAFRLLGRVVSRDVKVGDIVSKGTTIATLDPTALELAVQAARAESSRSCGFGYWVSPPADASRSARHSAVPLVRWQMLLPWLGCQVAWIVIKRPHL